MSMTFTLQVSDRGAWRNVIRGNKEQMESIEHHVSVIAEIIGKSTKWRIVESPFQRVIGYCNAPDFIWRPA